MGQEPDIRMGPVSDFSFLEFADYTNVTKVADADATIPEYWSERVVAALYDMSIVAKIATDISRDTSHPSDALYAFLETALSGAGTSADGTALEGNEEKVTWTQKTFNVESLDHAVAFSRQLILSAIFDPRERARDLLSNWLTQKIEGKLLTDLEGCVTKRFYGGTATSPATIVAGSTIDPEDVERAVFSLIKAKVPGFTIQELKNWFGVPADELVKSSNPYADGGWYIGILHPGQIFDLTQTTAWSNAANAASTATLQSILGPKWQGRFFAWNGCLMLPSNNVSYSAGGYGTAAARAFVCGRDAIAFGWSRLRGQSGIEWVESMYDYERIRGAAILSRFGHGCLDPERARAIYTSLSTKAQGL